MTSRRAQRRCRDAAPAMSMVLAWAQGDDDIEAASKGAHDELIAQLGQRRRGGVTFRVYGDDADAVVRKFQALPGNTPEHAAHYRRLRGHLREYGGFIVVASAPCVP